jgi:hypothetical protein
MRSWGFGKRERLKCSIEVCSSESGSRSWRSALFEPTRPDQRRLKPKMLVHSPLFRRPRAWSFVVKMSMVEEQLGLELLPVPASNT